MTRSDARCPLVVGLLAVVSLSASGCGSVSVVSSDGGNADAAAEAAAVTVDEACTQVAQALCDALNSCAPVFVEEEYGTELTCVDRTKLSCITDQSLQAITRTPDDLVACAKAAPSTSCADALAGLLPTACQTKPGTLANGVACGSDLQCQSAYCNKTSTCGVCSPRQAAGGACTADDGCAEGLVCASKVCVMPSGMGAACSLPAQPCRADLYCTSPSGPGTCATRIGATGPCADNPNDACDVFKGDICNTLNHTCITIEVASGGETCGIAAKTVCVGGIAPCSNIILGGVCANPAPDGDACGGNAVCIPPATCVNNLCSLPSAPNCQ